MKRQPVTLDWMIFIGFVVLLAMMFSTGLSSAIKKQPQTCSDELEEIRTQLRLRTAELRVAHGQLDAAWKKLKKCGVSTEEE